MAAVWPRGARAWGLMRGFESLAVHQILRARTRTRAAPNKSGFRHNFSKKLSPGPKNGLESCVSRFSTICAKNQVLKLKIDKVTVIRATNF
jgi:hypothetical protein